MLYPDSFMKRFFCYRRGAVVSELNQRYSNTATGVFNVYGVDKTQTLEPAKSAMISMSVNRYMHLHTQC